MAEFCKDCKELTICDFCSYFKPDRPFSEERGECENGWCSAKGVSTYRSSGANCDNFRCFKLDT